MVGTPVEQQYGQDLDRSPELWLVDLAAGAPLLTDFARDHGLIPAATASAGAPRDTARAALRILLAGHIGVAAARRPFDISPRGKPSLRGDIRPRIEFSLAHCETVALIAMSSDGAIGVDLEAPRSVRIASQRRASLIAAATVLCPDTPLPDGPGDAGFLQAWTRLEALAKATGEGIGALLERLRRGEAVAGQAAGPDQPICVRDVTVRSTSPFYAAVAVVSTSLASGAPPETASVPLDRAWLERWLTGEPASGQPGTAPSP